MFYLYRALFQHIVLFIPTQFRELGTKNTPVLEKIININNSKQPSSIKAVIVKDRKQNAY